MQNCEEFRLLQIHTHTHTQKKHPENPTLSQTQVAPVVSTIQGVPTFTVHSARSWHSKDTNKPTTTKPNQRAALPKKHSSTDTARPAHSLA